MNLRPTLDRTALLEKKEQIDADLHKAKLAVSEARRRAAAYNEHLTPEAMRALEDEMHRIGRVSQKVQREIGEVNRLEKERNRNRGNTELECFKKVARARLSESLFLDICDEAKEMANE